MESLFDDIFAIDGVYGVLIISKEGGHDFSKFKSPLMEKINQKKCKEFIEKSIDIKTMNNVFEKSRETLMLYGQKRLYIKNTDNGFLFIIMDMFVPIAMVRLNCQLLVPELNKIKSPKGLGRFFRK